MELPSGQSLRPASAGPPVRYGGGGAIVVFDDVSELWIAAEGFHLFVSGPSD